ncbi:MAG TPA: hypothetical protein VFL91_33210 [Thermomicrobiales bacterium]|nr:hypothetical protein [Thermomicrobiales bacterium]
MDTTAALAAAAATLEALRDALLAAGEREAATACQRARTALRRALLERAERERPVPPEVAARRARVAAINRELFGE